MGGGKNGGKGKCPRIPRGRGNATAFPPFFVLFCGSLGKESSQTSSRTREPFPVDEKKKEVHKGNNKGGNATAFPLFFEELRKNIQQDIQQDQRALPGGFKKTRERKGGNATAFPLDQ